MNETNIKDFDYSKSPDHVVISHFLFKFSKEYLPRHWVNVLFVKQKSSDEIYLNKNILKSEYNLAELHEQIDPTEGLKLLFLIMRIALPLIIIAVTIAAELITLTETAFYIAATLLVSYLYNRYRKACYDTSKLVVEQLVNKSK